MNEQEKNIKHEILFIFARLNSVSVTCSVNKQQLTGLYDTRESLSNYC